MSPNLKRDLGNECFMLLGSAIQLLWTIAASGDLAWLIRIASNVWGSIDLLVCGYERNSSQNLL